MEEGGERDARGRPERGRTGDTYRGDGAEREEAPKARAGARVHGAQTDMYEYKVWEPQGPDNDAEGKTEGTSWRGADIEPSPEPGGGNPRAMDQSTGPRDTATRIRRSWGARTVAYARKREGTE